MALVQSAAKKAIVCGVVALTLSALVWGCDGESKDNAVGETSVITVFAAASTIDALTEVARAYESAAGVKVRFSFASSSILARQIESGALVDIFMSADRDWMDDLDAKDLIKAESRADLLGNRLVVIAPRGQGFEIRMDRAFDFAGAFEGRLAVGDPCHVPAGRYARKALEHMGWWTALERRLAPALDVRGALLFVERGEVAAGIVYVTDAVRSDGVEIIATLPERSHPPIRYPVALCRDSRPAAGKFLEHLLSAEAAKVFRKYGFTVLVGE